MLEATQMTMAELLNATCRTILDFITIEGLGLEQAKPVEDSRDPDEISNR